MRLPPCTSDRFLVNSSPAMEQIYEHRPNSKDIYHPAADAVQPRRQGAVMAEAKLVAEHREQLWSLLIEAAQFEHMIMCQYLVTNPAS